MCREALSTTLFSPGPAVAHPRNQERLHSSLYRETALIVHCLTSDRQILVSIPRHPARRQATTSPPITSLFDFDLSLFKFRFPSLLCLFIFFFARSINFGSRENQFRSLLHDNVRVFLHLIYWSYIYVDIYIHLTFGESIANRDEHEKISWNLFINIFKRNCFFLLLLLFGIILIKKEKKLNIYICVSLIKL